MELLRVRRPHDEDAEPLVPFRPLQVRDFLEGSIPAAARVGEPSSLFHVRGVLELFHHDPRDDEQDPVDALPVRPGVDAGELVEQVFSEDRGIQDVRVDPEDRVLFRSEATRRGGKPDGFDVARTQERGVQPVEVLRRVLEDPEPERRRRAEDLDQWEFLFGAAGPERPDRNLVDLPFDGAERELHCRKFRDLSSVEEFAKAHHASARRRSTIHFVSKGRISSYVWPRFTKTTGLPIVFAMESAAPPFASASIFVRMIPSIPTASWNCFACSMASFPARASPM